jgi:hypothetical protein
MPARRYALAAPLAQAAAVALAPGQPTTTTPPELQLTADFPDGIGFVSVKVSEVWDRPAFLPVRVARGNVEFVWMVQSLVGLPPGELDRLTVYWPTADPAAPLLMVSTRKPADARQVAKTLTRKPDPAPKGLPDGLLFAPGAEFPYVLPLADRVFVLAPASADPKGLMKLAGRGSRAAGPLADVAAKVGDHGLTIGLNVRAAEKVLGKDQLPDALRAADTAVLTVDLKGDEKGQARLALNCPDPAAATAAAPGLEKLLKDAARWAAARQKQLAAKPEAAAAVPLLEWIGKTLTAAKVRADGRVVAASAEVDLAEGVARLMSVVPDSALAGGVGAFDAGAVNNLKQIALAVHNYHDANNKMPSNIHDKDGKAILSWRVQILPYIEQDNVYRQMKLDEPWDSPANKRFSELQIKVFSVPTRPAPNGFTYFRAFIGTKDVNPVHRPWLKEGEEKGPTLAGISDGTSNTILVVEAAEAVPWSKPEELPYDGELPLPQLGGPSGRYSVAFMDGSVRTFRRGQIDEVNLRRLITVAGGEVVNIPDR